MTGTIAIATLMLAALPASAQLFPFPGPGGEGVVAASFGTATQDVHASCGTSLTCTLTVASTGTGHLLVLVGQVYSTTHIAEASWPVYASASGGGSWVWCPSCTNYARLAYADQVSQVAAYVLSSTSGTTSVSMTLTGSAPSGWALEFVEVPYTGSGLALDGAGINTSTSCGSSACVGATLPISGTTDYLLQYIRSFQAAPTGITGAYTDFTDYVSATKSAVAGAKNTTTGTAPSWSGIGGNSYAMMGGAAFGFGTTPCTNSTVQNWSGGGEGVNPTAANLLTGTFGTAIAPNWATNSGAYWSVLTGTGLTYTTAAYIPFTNSPRPCLGGFTDATTRGLQYSTSTTTASVKYFFPDTYTGTSTQATVQCRFNTNVPDTDNGGWYDMCSLVGQPATQFVNISLENWGRGSTNGLKIWSETMGGESAGEWIPVPSGGCYVVDAMYTPSAASCTAGIGDVTCSNKIQVRTCAGTLIQTNLGHNFLTGYNTAVLPPGEVTFGRTGGYGTPTAGYIINIGNVQWCWLGSCPWPMPL